MSPKDLNKLSHAEIIETMVNPYETKPFVIVNCLNLNHVLEHQGKPSLYL